MLQASEAVLCFSLLKITIRAEITPVLKLVRTATQFLKLWNRSVTVASLGQSARTCHLTRLYTGCDLPFTLIALQLIVKQSFAICIEHS